MRLFDAQHMRVVQVRGFTLIEVLVVIVIVAVVAATVTLSIASAGGERQLGNEANRLQSLIVYACEQSELGGREIGLSIDQTGYRFDRIDHAAWLAIRDGELRARKWSVPIEAQLTREGNPVEIAAKFPDQPQLICFSSGELTAFNLQLAIADVAVQYIVKGKPEGDISVTQRDVVAR